MVDEIKCPHCRKIIKVKIEYKESLGLDYDTTTNTAASFPAYEMILTFEKED